MSKLQLSKIFSEAVCDFIYDKLDNVRNEWGEANPSEKLFIFVAIYTLSTVMLIFISAACLGIASLFFKSWIGYIGLPSIFTYWILMGGEKDEG